MSSKKYDCVAPAIVEDTIENNKTLDRTNYMTYKHHKYSN